MGKASIASSLGCSIVPTKDYRNEEMHKMTKYIFLDSDDYDIKILSSEKQWSVQEYESYDDGWVKK